jgi:hypothetical protein
MTPSQGWFGMSEAGMYSLVPVLIGALVVLVWFLARRRAKAGRYRY